MLRFSNVFLSGQHLYFFVRTAFIFFLSSQYLFFVKSAFIFFIIFVKSAHIKLFMNPGPWSVLIKNLKTLACFKRVSQNYSFWSEAIKTSFLRRKKQTR